MENIVDNMSQTPQSHAPANENESAPSSSSHPKKKRRTKDKTFDNIFSNMRAMVESISAMVPKLDGLISVLSTAIRNYLIYKLSCIMRCIRLVP